MRLATPPVEVPQEELLLLQAVWWILLWELIKAAVYGCPHH